MSVSIVKMEEFACAEVKRVTCSTISSSRIDFREKKNKYRFAKQENNDTAHSAVQKTEIHKNFGLHLFGAPTKSYKFNLKRWAGVWIFKIFTIQFRDTTSPLPPAPLPTTITSVQKHSKIVLQGLT